jgi:nuclear transport factor 2 (NTF2) superfamily protein
LTPNEHRKVDERGLMKRRDSSINHCGIDESEGRPVEERA